VKQGNFKRVEEVVQRQSVRDESRLKLKKKISAALSSFANALSYKRRNRF
jgi:hypothetical protein